MLITNPIISGMTSSIQTTGVYIPGGAEGTGLSSLGISRCGTTGE